VPKVKVRKNESFDHALRRFIAEVNKTGVLKEVRLRDRFTKQSQIKREKEKARKRKIRMDQRKRRG
jgi:small subunit ribosomal protein S21